MVKHVSKVRCRSAACCAVVFAVILMGGCATAPPNDIDSICSIFRQYPKWFWAAQDVQKKWRVPMSVLMAVMHQESKFRAGAKPPRRKLLWIIPWTRPTSAYGYSQATNASWRSYKRTTGNGGANRDAFAAAADFIGWYAQQAHVKTGLSKGNPYALYLAYHEGIGGYSRATYKHKPWLMGVARKVERKSWIYHNQLMRCIKSLPRKSWWRLW